MYVKLKNLVTVVIFSDIAYLYTFSDKINFEKVKKVDPCNPNFFHDKYTLEAACFLNHHNITVSGSGGG
jgi:hypothetical protein